jgi:hypothetical protein
MRHKLNFIKNQKSDLIPFYSISCSSEVENNLSPNLPASQEGCTSFAWETLYRAAVLMVLFSLI